MASTKTLADFLKEYACSEEEAKQLSAVLFAMRYKDIDMLFLEKIIRKYEHLIKI